MLAAPEQDETVRFLATSRRSPDERLLWSRDIRFVRRLAIQVSGSRLLELDTGMVLIGPADQLTDSVAGHVAEQVNMPEYGLVAVDPSYPESDRYLVAMSAAVQLSGLADRIGMAQSTQVVQTKMLDYFFSLRKLHTFAYQPIVTLATGELYEYECLFRPQMPMLQQSISSVVQAAINTDRGVELDTYIVATALERIGRLEATAREAGMRAASLRHQPHAVQPARRRVRGERTCRPGPLLRPRAAPDHDRVHRAAVRPRSRPAPAPGQGPAPARFRVRGR